MRIELLQIGDLVNINDKDLNIYGNYRVEGIEKHEEGYGIVVSDRQLVFFDDCVKPIPLTEDIVSHNIHLERYLDVSEELPLGTVAEYMEETETAFIKVYCYHDRKRKLVVEIRLRSNNDRIYLHINYVHQLQQAFRLFGLNELADNFVI